jgi:CheY-like chemotaxis protein
MAVIALSDPAERRRFASFLSENGFVVLDASDAQDACSLVSRFLPEIAVCDLGWPDLNLARRLRSDPLSEAMGIVALGPALAPADEQAARAAGVDVVLETPCLPETLLTELLVLLAALIANSDNLQVAPKVDRGSRENGGATGG